MTGTRTDTRVTPRNDTPHTQEIDTIKGLAVLAQLAVGMDDSPLMRITCPDGLSLRFHMFDGRRCGYRGAMRFLSTMIERA